MNLDKRLERDWKQLEADLLSLPPQERATVILRFKTRLDEAIKRPTQKRPIHIKWWGWLLLLSLAMFVLATGSVMLLLWRITPFLDFSNSHFQTFTKVLQQNPSIVRPNVAKINKSNNTSVTSQEFRGEIKLDNVVNKVKLNAQEGIFDFKLSSDKILSWKCESKDIRHTLNTDKYNDSFHFNTNQLSDITCKIEIPKDVKIVINGAPMEQQPIKKVWLEKGLIKKISR
ncbi:MAG: hypothetical protein ACOCUT_02980 [bacterium]